MLNSSKLKKKIKSSSIIRIIYNRMNRIIKCNKVVKRGRGNLIIKKDSTLLNSKITFKGNNNSIILCGNSRMNNCIINVYGDNNRILIGELSHIKDSEFWIKDDNNLIQVGSKTTMEKQCHLAAIEGTSIIIGDDCMFSSDITIRTGDSHSILNMNKIRINPSLDVKIGNHVWVGHRAVILKGVNLPSDSIIGTHSLVTKPFKDENTIIAGVPAKVVVENTLWNRQRV